MMGVWDLNIFQIETSTNRPPQILGQPQTPNFVISMPASDPLCHRNYIHVVMDVISSDLNSIRIFDTPGVIMLELSQVL